MQLNFLLGSAFFRELPVLDQIVTAPDIVIVDFIFKMRRIDDRLGLNSELEVFVCLQMGLEILKRCLLGFLPVLLALMYYILFDLS